MPPLLTSSLHKSLLLSSPLNCPKPSRVSWYQQSFIPFTDKLWNRFPLPVLPPPYDLNIFLRGVWGHLSNSPLSCFRNPFLIYLPPAVLLSGSSNFVGFVSFCFCLWVASWEAKMKETSWNMLQKDEPLTERKILKRLKQYNGEQPKWSAVWKICIS